YLKSLDSLFSLKETDKTLNNLLSKSKKPKEKLKDLISEKKTDASFNNNYLDIVNSCKSLNPDLTIDTPILFIFSCLYSDISKVVESSFTAWDNQQNLTNNMINTFFYSDLQNYFLSFFIRSKKPKQDI